ncbi:MAG TPA: hypothetical protein VKB76_11720, partial [Ktedonobacterales bacterium]|nr:hypothetical protein [Ktedonobacterales bacterium]
MQTIRLRWGRISVVTLLCVAFTLAACAQNSIVIGPKDGTGIASPTVSAPTAEAILGKAQQSLPKNAVLTLNFAAHDTIPSDLQTGSGSDVKTSDFTTTGTGAIQSGDAQAFSVSYGITIDKQSTTVDIVGNSNGTW